MKVTRLKLYAAWLTVRHSPLVLRLTYYRFYAAMLQEYRIKPNIP